METISLPRGMTLLYVTATSFPEGVMAAHNRLHALVPFSEDRKYYGISRPENGSGIVYRAAAEEIRPGEAAQLGCDTLVLKKGNYIALRISDYMTDTQQIGKAFQQLLAQPGLDHEGYCVEEYTSKTEVICMVRLHQ